MFKQFYSENFENICTSMTPTKLLSFYNNDIHLLKDALIRNRIEPRLISNPANYNEIADKLLKAREIKC
jgi:hypothetical protein